jgi:hypothetical protein
MTRRTRRLLATLRFAFRVIRRWSIYLETGGLLLVRIGWSRRASKFEKFRFEKSCTDWIRRFRSVPFTASWSLRNARIYVMPAMEREREAVGATGLSMVTVSWSGFKELKDDMATAEELTMSRDWVV